jgi:predicted O-methyltransferase YrrM
MRPWDRIIQLAVDLGDQDFLIYGSHVLANNYLNHYWRYGKIYQPKRILELGVRYGYTGLMLMDGSQAPYYMGVDIDAQRLKLAQSHFEAWHPTARAELICADVRSWEPDGLELFDLIHLDSYHEDVTVELELAEPLLRLGGVMIVDDVREHWVMDPALGYFEAHGYVHSHVESLTGQLIGVKH